MNKGSVVKKGKTLVPQQEVTNVSGVPVFTFLNLPDAMLASSISPSNSLDAIKQHTDSLFAKLLVCVYTVGRP
jgi:hypothetical protein